MLLFLAQAVPVSFNHSGNAVGGVFVIGAVAIGLLALLTRLAAGSMDGDRVERYLSDRGCTLIEREWEPFGPGWFGKDNSRIYGIVYRDRQGLIHRAHVKTSMWSGVYLTDDVVIGSADSGAAGGVRAGAGSRAGRAGSAAIGAGQGSRPSRPQKPKPADFRQSISTDSAPSADSGNVHSGGSRSTGGRKPVAASESSQPEIMIRVAQYEALLDENERLQQQIHDLQAQLAERQRQGVDATQPLSDAPDDGGYRS